MFERVLRNAGCDRGLAEAAFQVFFAARNRVTLFDDVVPALHSLKRNYVLVALTDGNADLNLVGLGRFFHHYISAASVGAPKPDQQMFAAVLQATNLRCDQVAHVGDDPEKDVIGAQRFGLRGIWVNRGHSPWPIEREQPDAEVANLDMLVTGLERIHAQ